MQPPEPQPAKEAEPRQANEAPSVEPAGLVTANARSENSKRSQELLLACKSESWQSPRLFIELCCGTAGLTAACSKAGFRAFGVDNLRNKSGKAKGHVLMLDLTSTGDQKFIASLLTPDVIAAVHMGPPCGTASRARDRPLSIEARKQRIRRPQPLRSAKFPEGLPGLRWRDRARVQSANKVYEFCALVAKRCSELNVPWAIENPANSWFWSMPAIKELSRLKGTRDVLYDACMHGGSRKKATKLRVNFAEAEALALRCDMQHNHLPWSFDKDKGFATASEAEYHHVLCTRLAACFAEAARSRGWNIVPAAKATSHKRISAAIAAQRQPKRSKTGPLVPEFKHVVHLVGTTTVQEGQKFVVDTDFNGTLIPAGSKRLRMTPKGVRSETNEAGETNKAEVIEGAEAKDELASKPSKRAKLAENKDEKDEKTEAESLKQTDLASVSIKSEASFSIGVFRTQVEFFEEAKKVVHPALKPPVIDDDIAKAIALMLSRPKSELAKFREQQLKKYEAELSGLIAQEKELHEKAHPDVQNVIKGKNLLLLRKMMHDAGIKDDRLIFHMAAGFPVSGLYPDTGLFPSQERSASIDRDELWRTARYAQKKVVEITRASGDREIDDYVWNATIQERDRQWCSGPFSASEISERVGKLWIPSRRFGLRQPGKIRLIDDLSEFQVNATLGLQEKLELGGLDEILAVARAMQECVSSQSANISTFSGQDVRMKVHEDWKDAKVLGRTLDLSHAYKQLAARPSDSSLCVLSVFCPNENRANFFIAHALTFGSTASVMSFNWAAVILRKIMTRLFAVVTTSYFDDYPTLEFDCMEGQAQSVMERALHLLGWTFASEEKKRKPFAETFKALGARIDLSDIRNMTVRIGNTQERKDALTSELAEALKTRILRAPHAASLRGRFGFAYSFFGGRPMAAPLRQLSLRAEQSGGSVRIHGKLQQALASLAAFVKTAGDRTLRFDPKQETVILFTDGSFEEGKGKCGAVLHEPSSKATEFWGLQIPDKQINEWNSLGSSHAIAQSELYPVAVSLQTWKEKLNGKFVILFVDNNAVLDSLIKGNTGCLASLDLLSSVCKQILVSQCILWVTRVPSASNIADGPSRGDYSIVSSIDGAVEIAPATPQELNLS